MGWKEDERREEVHMQHGQHELAADDLKGLTEVRLAISQYTQLGQTKMVFYWIKEKEKRYIFT